MTSVNSIQFQDTAASQAWDSADLEAFDETSELADEIDADDDGYITEDEINTYLSEQDSEPENYTTLELDSDSVPDSYIEMADLLNQAITSFEEMTSYIEDELAEYQAEAEDASTPPDSDSILSDLEQVVSDIDTTSSAVDTILAKANKTQNKLFFGTSFYRYFVNFSSDSADVAKINELGEEAKAGAQTATETVEEVTDEVNESVTEMEETEEKEDTNLNYIKFKNKKTEE